MVGEVGGLPLLYDGTQGTSLDLSAPWRCWPLRSEQGKSLGAWQAAGPLLAHGPTPSALSMIWIKRILHRMAWEKHTQIVWHHSVGFGPQALVEHFDEHTDYPRTIILHFCLMTTRIKVVFYWQGHNYSIDFEMVTHLEPLCRLVWGALMFAFSVGIGASVEVWR